MQRHIYENCRAPGLLPSMSEITHVSSGPDDGLGAEEQSELDLDEVYAALEVMKQRAKKLRSYLVKETNVNETMTARYDKCEKQIELHGSQNEEVRQMQRDAARMVQRVKHTLENNKAIRKNLMDMNTRVQLMSKDTQQLSKQMGEFPQWKEQVQHKFGLCIERFHDLNMRCCDSKVFCGHMLKMKTDFISNTAIMVPYSCFKIDRRKMALMVARTREMIQISSDLLNRHATQLETCLAEIRSKGHWKPIHSMMNIQSSYMIMPTWQSEQAKRERDEKEAQRRASRHL